MNDIIILQASLERIAVSLERICRALEHPRITPEPVQVEQPAPAPAPTAEPEKVEEPAQPEPTKPTVTIDQIRKMVVALSAMGKEKKDAVREIITSYAPNVSGIPFYKYPEVMDKLTALQEG